MLGFRFDEENRQHGRLQICFAAGAASAAARLLALCRSWELKGTILLSAEGINLFVAGAAEKIELLLAELRGCPASKICRRKPA
jgi:predicted sulfurtransferase